MYVSYYCTYVVIRGIVWSATRLRENLVFTIESPTVLCRIVISIVIVRCSSFGCTDKTSGHGKDAVQAYSKKYSREVKQEYTRV